MTQDEITIACADDELDGEERHAEEATEQFVSFRLGSEWYAIAIISVREVVLPGRITYLPSAPAPIAGVMNLRGNIVSVTDPKRLFDLPSAPVSNQARIVVIETSDAQSGLLVDEVGEVVTVPVSQLEPPLATLDPVQVGFIEHTCRWEDRLLAIVKTEKLLASVGSASLGEA